MKIVNNKGKFYKAFELLLEQWHDLKPECRVQREANCKYLKTLHLIREGKKRKRV
jgi:hypothetical protein